MFSKVFCFFCILLVTASALEDQLCVGSLFGCYLVAGRPHCWGAVRGFGGLREGDKVIGNFANEQAQALEFSGVAKIYCGAGTLYAITNEGKVICHGDNTFQSCALGVNTRGGQLSSGQLRFKGWTVANMTAKLLTQEEEEAGVVVVAVAPQTWYNAACYLFSNLQVKCMGYEGFNFALARDNDTVPSNATRGDIPWVQIDGNPLLATQLSCGQRHCVALQNSTNKVIVWGSNSKGQLGMGSFTEYETRSISDSLPVGVNLENNIESPDVPVCNGKLQVQAKEDSTCVLCDDNQVRCWGDNKFAQGNGNVEDQYSNDKIGDEAAEMNSTSVPGLLPIGTGLGVTKISLVEDGTCVKLNTTSKWKCFGRRTLNGQMFNTMLLNGDALPVVELGSVEVVEVKGGEQTTCFSTVAGAVKCFGLRRFSGTRNGYAPLGLYNEDYTIGDDEGEMGDALVQVSFADRTSSPTSAIPAFVAPTANQLCVGYRFGCYLINGRPHCWGDPRAFGGYIEQEVQRGQYMDYADYSVADEAGEKAQALELFNITKLFCGYETIFGLTTDGKIVCHGEWSYNQCALGDFPARGFELRSSILLGVGATVGANMTAKLLGAGEAGLRVTHASIGTATACYLFSNHKIKCAGECTDFQCGTATFREANATGGDIPFLQFNETDVLASQLACGARHCCVVTLAETVLCFGMNNKGQLGIGSNESSLPTIVNLKNNLDNPSTAICSAPQLHAGLESTCVLCGDHRVRCWGDNSYGHVLGSSEDGMTWGSVASELNGTVVPRIHPIGAGFFVTKLRMIHSGLCVELNETQWKCMGAKFLNGLREDTSVAEGDLDLGGNNASVVDLRGAYGETCFVNAAKEVRCFGQRQASGTSDWYTGEGEEGPDDNDEYIGDDATEMGDALKVVNFGDVPLADPETNSPSVPGSNSPVNAPEPVNICVGKNIKRCKTIARCRIATRKVGKKRLRSCVLRG